MKTLDLPSTANALVIQSGETEDLGGAQLLELSSDELGLVGGGDDVICW